MTRETCATCRFFDVGDVHGECRKSPPALYGDRCFSAARFPPTQPAYWCGEHQPVAPAPAAPDDYTRAGMAWVEALAVYHTRVSADVSSPELTSLSADCVRACAAFLRLYRERHDAG